MFRRAFFRFGLLAFLLALATEAMAVGLTVDTVIAIEYDSGVFAAAVLAHGPTTLADAQLEVNGVAVVPDRTGHLVLAPRQNLTLFKFTKFGREAVVHPGDVVTAVVTDMAGTEAEKAVTCVQGRFLHQLVVCR